MAAHSSAVLIMANTRMTAKPRAVFNKDNHQLRVPFELKQGQTRLFHKLSSGLNMEVIFQKGLTFNDPTEESQNPPLVFVHGSFHAAWCWAEHWLPFFSEFGFDCYALSLLGQGESDDPTGSVAGTLQTHAGDVADFIRKQTKVSPVLIGHSFGGLIVQYYIANLQNEQMSGKVVTSDDFHLSFNLRLCNKEYTDLAGAVLVCSVPPTGNSGLVWRYLFSKPIAAFKVTLSLAAKGFQTSFPLCKETFFSEKMENHRVLRYQKLMTKSSRMPLFDLKKLNASLPVPSTPNSSLKVLVMGAAEDFIVDKQALSETGRFYDVEPVCIEGVGHDMMLDSSWSEGAEVILSWLEDSYKNKKDAP